MAICRWSFIDVGGDFIQLPTNESNSNGRVMHWASMLGEMTPLFETSTALVTSEFALIVMDCRHMAKKAISEGEWLATLLADMLTLLLVNTKDMLVQISSFTKAPTTSRTLVWLIVATGWRRWRALRIQQELNVTLLAWCHLTMGRHEGDGTVSGRHLESGRGKRVLINKMECVSGKCAGYPLPDFKHCF